MVNAVIQNSFVSGELSPEMHGRHDMKQYFQGAAKIRNFVPRRSGGVRKRSGSQLISAMREGAAAYRTVPYIFDRTRYGILFLYIAGDLSVLMYRFKKSDGTMNAAVSTGLSSFSADNLRDLDYKQIGDTIYFTLERRRTFRCMVTFEENAVEWNEMPTGVDVTAAPALNSTVTGMAVAGVDGFRESERKYAIWGVRNGIFSSASERTVKIVLAWQAGAKVRLSFTPNWDQHDYYVLGKRLGSDYAHMAAFYPDAIMGDNKDATFANSGVAATIILDGVTYAASTMDIATKWKESPDILESGIHPTAAVVDGTLSFDTKTTSPVLSLRIWFGAKLAPSGGGTAVAVGAFGYTTLRLKNHGTEIASWDVNPAYTERDVLLTVVDPKAVSYMDYTLEIENEYEKPVVIRGFVAVSDSSTLSYDDLNVEPSVITGLQEYIQVGDSGMDCALCEIWQQRLVFASSRGNPFTMWFSSVGNLLSFYAMRPQTIADAFSVSIPPVAATKILHMYSGQWLILFTESGEYICSSGDQPFGYATVNLQRVSSIGASEDVKPIDTASTLLFVGADNRSVYSMRYDLAQDGVVPMELSMLAGHLTEGKKIIRLAYQRFPDSVAWCLLDDGSLISITWQPDQEVLAWARHDFGDSGAGMKLVDIVSLSSVREVEECDACSEMLLVWESTKEAEAGSVWIERMRAQSSVDVPTIAAARCVDHSGYDEAEWPGGVDPEIPVDAELDTLRPESQNFNTMGLEKTVLQCTARLFRSGAISVKPLRGGLDDSKAGGVVIEDIRVVLSSGDQKVLPRSFYNSDGQMRIKSADIYPCEIQSVRFNVSFEDVNASGEGEG